ncbi:MAG: Rpn family recombination-promoting nuclease/putative transposase [Magnetococcus sp. MYC-9]
MKFIDPRIDFAFKKIFGSDSTKAVLISFLESLLGLEGERCIAELTILDPFLAPRIREMEYSILDVKCRDHRGVSYIVEMQVHKVAAFLKRIQYNAAKTYVHQIEHGEDYPKLNQVIAVTITDFVLFHAFHHCVSCHESRETVTGNSYLQDIVHFFVELPKFSKTLGELDSILDRWIYFIRYAGSLQEIPDQLHDVPFRHAFEVARAANMTREELELYENAGIALTDAQGSIELAREEGIQIGEQRREAAVLTRQLQRRFGPLPGWVTDSVAHADLATLETWSLRILDVATLEEVFADLQT